LVPILVSSPVGENPYVAPVTQSDVFAGIEAKDYVDRFVAHFHNRIYLGDGFPIISLRPFGPVLGAALLGAGVELRDGRIWYRYEDPPDPRDFDVSRLEKTEWRDRVVEVIAEAGSRFGNSVCVATPELGGILDILEAIYGADELIFHLLDYPDEMERIVREIEAVWHRWFGLFDNARHGGGYTDFSGIWSPTPSYSLYSDFSALLSPALFSRFVAPEIRRSADRLSHSIYHLDGPDQIRHLDQLLGIHNLDAIQWVPGAGSPGAEQWSDLYRTIRSAGKRCQVLAFGGRRRLLDVADAIASAGLSLDGFCLLGGWALNKQDGERLEKQLADPIGP
jgi:5-methyltetrahydrofolate--homocysteine methyltransferase